MPERRSARAFKTETLEAMLEKVMTLGETVRDWEAERSENSSDSEPVGRTPPRKTRRLVAQLKTFFECYVSLCQNE